MWKLREIYQDPVENSSQITILSQWEAKTKLTDDGVGSTKQWDRLWRRIWISFLEFRTFRKNWPRSSLCEIWIQIGRTVRLAGCFIPALHRQSRWLVPSVSAFATCCSLAATACCVFRATHAACWARGAHRCVLDTLRAFSSKPVAPTPSRHYFAENLQNFLLKHKSQKRKFYPRVAITQFLPQSCINLRGLSVGITWKSPV